MFNLTQSPTFKADVEFQVNDENGVVTAKFKAIFKRTEQDEVDELVKKQVSDEDVVRQKLVGWEGVDGAFSKENLDRMLALDGMRGVLALAFMNGNSVAARKN